MSRKSSYKFQIGDCVQVNKEVFFDHTIVGDVKRIILQEECNKKGIICGIKIRYTGKLQDLDDYYVQAMLIPEKTYHVYLIRQGMINKPIEALEDDIEILNELEIKSNFPLSYRRRESNENQ